MDPEQPLIHRPAAAVDHRGRPASRTGTGGWNSALFVIGVEIAERFAFYGLSTNLISYLTGTLGESTATAAANVNAWSGVASMLPLLGGLVADRWLGRYRTILGASLLYILALGLLTLSATAPGLQPKCSTDSDATCSPSSFQAAFFFCSIYLVSLAQGGHKPCIQAFGADQFDENDPEECKSKSSFFNWWYFGLCLGTVAPISALSYIQDSISWGLGFGIPCLVMVLALLAFLVGRRTYRYRIDHRMNFLHEGVTSDGKNNSSLELDPQASSRSGCSCILSAVKRLGKEGALDEESDAAALRKLFPIWVTCLVYAVVFAQSSTFFTKQGSTMDRRIGPTFQVPPAALQSFISIMVVAFIPIYDRVLVPVARKLTGLPSGITMLQRIGTGMVLSMISMVVASVVEMRRLQTAKKFAPVTTMVPMSLWWLVPQYILFGVADVFTMVGLQEFFYDQVPDRLRCLGLALYLSIFGIGSLISSLLVSAIDKVSRRSGGSWFSDDLNAGHLDYFYLLLAGLSAFQFIIYMCFSRVYVYKEEAI